jgi:hypothetical protein
MVANTEHPDPVTIEETRVPRWFLAMFLLLIWPLWVAVAAPSPTPPWMHATAIAGWIIPIVTIEIGLIVVLRGHVYSRSRQSSLRNFRRLTPNETGPFRVWFDAAPWVSLGFRHLGVQSIEEGDYDGQTCEHIRLILREGEHDIPVFVTTVRTQPAPASAAARRSRSRWIPGFSRPRFKIGPVGFRQVGDAYGNHDTAEIFFIDEVCERLHSAFPKRSQIWLWSEDRLALLLWGRPTAYGADRALHAVVSVAEQAGILPDRGPSADKIEVP